MSALTTALSSSWQGRESQIIQLQNLLHASIPGPSALVIHGPEATGKSQVLRALLEAQPVLYAIVQSRECITSQHLFERALTASRAALAREGISVEAEQVAQCDSLCTLAHGLSGLLRHVPRFVLVLDGVDEQRDASANLLPALARLGYLIQGLTLVLVVRQTGPGMLHTVGLPHIYFPPYNEAQSIAILAKRPPVSQTTMPISDSDIAWLWRQYIGIIWNSIAKSVARDLISFEKIANSLWHPFLRPVIDGVVGARDVSRLVVAHTKLLQDEDRLGDTMLADSGHDMALSRPVSTASLNLHELPYYSKWIMCAAYLASFNPPVQDQIYFMKQSNRKRRRRGGPVAGRRSTACKIPRHLLSPSPFSLDRLVAILQAVMPHDLAPTADVHAQITRLVSLRLLLKSGILGSDMLDLSARWKVNIDRDRALTIAKTLNFDIADFLSE